ncbi:hypothetical protein QZH41_004456 [Actinostola sp. cb2023]|nr:hypothetical protein QZH41_004456 [Actinostola sp. cb2023]
MARSLYDHGTVTACHGHITVMARSRYGTVTVRSWHGTVTACHGHITVMAWAQHGTDSCCKPSRSRHSRPFPEKEAAREAGKANAEKTAAEKRKQTKLKTDRPMKPLLTPQQAVRNLLLRNHTFGEVVDVRLIRNMAGRSKGYAYIEFNDEFPTSLDKNTLFVSNLPFVIKESEVEEIFKKFGEVKQVRLVTSKAGKPKGYGYVEFADENCASKAIVTMDGFVVSERTISVALSNPPTRKSTRPEFPAPLPPPGSSAILTTVLSKKTGDQCKVHGIYHDVTVLGGMKAGLFIPYEGPESLSQMTATKCTESFSYEKKTYGMELRSQYGIEDIYSTNHSAQNHRSTNQKCLDTGRSSPHDTNRNYFYSYT